MVATRPRQVRSKEYGRETENAALRSLKSLFPNLRRTGSMAYRRSAADLVQDGDGETVRLVVTRDKRQPLLVTLSLSDLEYIAFTGEHNAEARVAVQVKGRQSSLIGRWWRELREATP